ncbi:MAG: transposase [bacterium]
MNSKHMRRLCGENLYHHVYAWGNDRHPTFKEENHYELYLNLLEKSSKKFDIDVIAYALMQWHVHLFIFDHFNKISKFMEELHGKYAILFNKETGSVGHVFGERFNNKIVQPNDYGLYLSSYIHRQAVEARLVVDPKDYPWTSYRQYIGLEPIRFIKPQVILEQFGDYVDFKKVARAYQEFVLNAGKDIKDWDDFKSPIVGTFGFVESLRKKLGVKVNQNYDKDELLSAISNELNISTEMLLNPLGLKQRQFRRKAINILIKDYDLKISEVARILKISRYTVMRNMD